MGISALLDGRTVSQEEEIAVGLTGLTQHLGVAGTLPVLSKRRDPTNTGSTLSVTEALGGAKSRLITIYFMIGFVCTEVRGG